MIEEWLAAVLIVFAYCYGFLVAWSICHEDHPFWKGYADVVTLRIIWQQWMTKPGHKQ